MTFYSGRLATDILATQHFVTRTFWYQDILVFGCLGNRTLLISKVTKIYFIVINMKFYFNFIFIYR